MQIELLNRQKWRTKIELAIAIADYIEHFYNAECRHSSLDYYTPVEFEDPQSKNPDHVLITADRETAFKSICSPNGIRTRASTLRG